MKIKKILFFVLLDWIIICLPLSYYAKAEELINLDDPARLNTIIMTLLMPTIQNAVNDFYEPYLEIKSTVVAYLGSKVIDIQGGEQASQYTVTVEVLPYVGPHLDVGKDRITLNIQSGAVVVENYEHLKSYELTPNYQSIIKKPLP